MTVSPADVLVWQAYDLLGEAGFSTAKLDSEYGRLGVPERDRVGHKSVFGWLKALDAGSLRDLIGVLHARYGPLPSITTLRHWYITPPSCHGEQEHDWRRDMCMNNDGDRSRGKYGVCRCSVCGALMLDLGEAMSGWSYRKDLPETEGEVWA